MPELNGFELLGQVGIETVPAVVFVTAHDRHALKAFEVDAVDFLLKPFDDERFAAAMRRVRAALAGAAGPAYLRRFVVRTGERIAVLDAHSVDWIEAADYYASLHVGDRTYLVRQTMSELARALDPAQFFRLQRSAIVNLDRVREIAPLAGGEHAVVLADGTSAQAEPRAAATSAGAARALR
jgi:two-component system LytT family response regulator